MFVHVVGRVPFGASDSAFWTHAEAADRLWLRLRDAFPDALAACIVPGYVHLLVPSCFEPRGSAFFRGVPAASALALLLTSGSWQGGSRAAWTPVSCRRVEPDVALTEALSLHERPCKLGLVSDPVLWPWSTERDLWGARLEPWVTAERLTRCAGRGAVAEGVAELRKYTPPEPGLSLVGNPLRAARFARCEEAHVLVSAVDAACVYVPRALRNALAVHFLQARGFDEVRWVAERIGVAHASVERILRAAPPPGLACVARCAADPRFFSRPRDTDLRAG